MLADLVSLGFLPSLTPSPNLGLAPAVLEVGLGEAESLPTTGRCDSEDGTDNSF